MYSVGIEDKGDRERGGESGRERGREGEREGGREEEREGGRGEGGRRMCEE